MVKTREGQGGKEKKKRKSRKERERAGRKEKGVKIGYWTDGQGEGLEGKRETSIYPHTLIGTGKHRLTRHSDTTQYKST